MKFTTTLTKWIFALAIAVAAVGCAKDDEAKPREGYGFVQLRLFKSGSYTRADEKYLSDAAKIRITLRGHDNTPITQTVVVTAVGKEIAEYGVQTDKFQLMVDDYTLTSYVIYDVLDQPWLSSEPDPAPVIKVVNGGLVTQDIVIDVTERGQIKFQLTKDLSQVNTRAGADNYPFHKIMFADVTIQNKATGEKTPFEGLKMTHKVFRPEDEPDYQTSVCETDSLVRITAGTYMVIGFTTYFDRNKKIWEHSSSVVTNEFTVYDNQITTADVPITLTESSGAIKDALVLKKIWEALDGPNWKTKWDFNRDVDLWTAQPGVEILENGRIASLNLENTGAKGDMPAVIGELAELRTLYLGTHSFEGGTSIINPASSTGGHKMYISPNNEERQAQRRSFTEIFSTGNGDGREKLSEELQLSFELKGDPVKKNTVERKQLASRSNANNPFNYATLIYSLPVEINNLTKLENLYIAFSPIKELPDDLSGLESLTDVEIYNCPDMTEFPSGLATLSRIQSLVFSCNYNVPADKMHDGLVALNSGQAAKTLQILDIPGQPMRSVPDLSGMKNLGQLNVQSCGIERFEEPFGKDVSLAKLIASYNELKELPRDEDGWFIGDANVESYNFSNNQFTEFPDMFDATSDWELGMIDFSFNQIETIENGGPDGNFKGLNSSNLSLAYNNLKKFPGEFYRAEGELAILQLQGNGIETFENEDLEGGTTKATMTLDLSYNKLKKLPTHFFNATFPYMNGLDLSYNSFDAYPWTAMSLANLAVFIFRNQTDEDGNRTFKTWPVGIGKHNALRALYLGGNDMRKVDDSQLSYRIYQLEVSDNPNISFDVSVLCPYIRADMFFLFYDPWQDIRGCDALKLDH